MTDVLPTHLRDVADILRERLANHIPGGPPLDVGPVSLVVTDPEAALADQQTRDLIEWIAREGRVCRVYVQLHAAKLNPQARCQHASLLDWLRPEGGEQP